MFISDYHTHSNFSPDSKAPMEEMVKKAIELNINEYCITDHLDTFDPNNDLEQLFKSEEYFKEYNRLKEKYKEKISLKVGIELGLEPKIHNKFYRFSQNHDFDFIIGSTHNLDFADFTSGNIFMHYSQDEFYSLYLNRLLKASKMNDCFDVLGHLDYICRYVPYKDTFIDYYKHSDTIDEIFKTLIQAGKGIEINTAGIRYNLGYVHPNNIILKRYKDLGGEILTIGSDSHRTNSLGEYYKYGVEAALDAGFKYYTRYEKRKPFFEKLT